MAASGWMMASKWRTALMKTGRSRLSQVPGSSCVRVMTGDCRAATVRLSGDVLEGRRPDRYHGAGLSSLDRRKWYCK